MRSTAKHTIFLACMLVASAARAQPAAPPERGAADDRERERERTALFQEGKEFAELGQWADAVDRFRRVVAIRSAPKALFTIGEAEEHLGQLAKAQLSYERALADARAAGDHAVAEAAENALQNLDAHVPTVSVLLDEKASHAFGATAHATVDGQATGFGTPKPLDPGLHEIRVEAPGARVFEQHITVLDGDRKYIVGALEPVAVISARQPPPPQSTPSPRHEHGPRLWGPLALGGLGLGLAVVGSLVRVNGAQDYDAIASRCPGGNCPTQQLRDDGNSAREHLTLGEVGIGAGALAVVGAAIWWWQLSSSAAGPTSAAVALDGEGARAVLRGAF